MKIHETGCFRYKNKELIQIYAMVMVLLHFILLLPEAILVQLDGYWNMVPVCL